MAIAKHCGSRATHPSTEGTYCAHCRTQPPRQPSDARPLDPAKRGHRDPGAVAQAAPAQGPECRGSRMALCREYGADEGESGSGPGGTAQLARVMRRAGDESPAHADRPGPAPAAQVHSSTERRRQPHVAGDHQHQPPITADSRQIAPQRRPPGLAVVPQYYAGKPLRQPRHRPSRIWQPPRIGEQPKRRHRAAAPHTIRPGQQSWVHLRPFACFACFAVNALVLLQSTQ
jgi:hypothetical protein